MYLCGIVRDLSDKKDKMYKLKLIDLSEAERRSELLLFDLKKNKN